MMTSRCLTLALLWSTTFPRRRVGSSKSRKSGLVFSRLVLHPNVWWRVAFLQVLPFRHDLYPASSVVHLTTDLLPVDVFDRIFIHGRQSLFSAIIFISLGNCRDGVDEELFFFWFPA